jgi:hypothetical protein
VSQKELSFLQRLQKKGSGLAIKVRAKRESEDATTDHEATEGGKPASLYPSLPASPVVGSRFDESEGITVGDLDSDPLSSEDFQDPLSSEDFQTFANPASTLHARFSPLRRVQIESVIKKHQGHAGKAVQELAELARLKEVEETTESRNESCGEPRAAANMQEVQDLAVPMVPLSSAASVCRSKQPAIRPSSRPTPVHTPDSLPGATHPSDSVFLVTDEPSPRSVVIDYFGGQHVQSSNEEPPLPRARHAPASDERASSQKFSSVHESRSVTPATDLEGIRVQSEFVGSDYYKQVYRDLYGA